jgi:hypothetical protein
MGLSIFLKNVWNAWIATNNTIKGNKNWRWTESNGATYYYLDNDLHREDGPAIEYANGNTSYWINGKQIIALNDKKIYGKDKLAKYLMLV